MCKGTGICCILIALKITTYDWKNRHCWLSAQTRERKWTGCLNPQALWNIAALVTDRIPIIMKAKNGTIIEVFEWKSKAAIEQAHTHPQVLKLWEEYAPVCEYVPVGGLEEIGNLFSEFSPFE